MRFFEFLYTSFDILYTRSLTFVQKVGETKFPKRATMTSFLRRFIDKFNKYDGDKIVTFPNVARCTPIQCTKHLICSIPLKNRTIVTVDVNSTLREVTAIFLSYYNSSVALTPKSGVRLPLVLPSHKLRHCYTTLHNSALKYGAN